MDLIKNIGIAVYIIVCISIIVLAMLQAKQGSGASGTIMGGGSSGEGNFYEKNKGRTKEGKMKRWTIILGIVFVVLSISLGIIWEIAQ